MPPNREDDERRVTYFAATHTRGKREMFGIRAADRGKHVYIIGKTGMGKSTMLENMAIQDIQNGEGVAFIDPHGAAAERLLDFVPHERIKDVLYIAPFDTDHPIGFNVMEDVGYDKRHLVVSGLIGAFKRIWVDMWSARMEYILQNTLLALLEYPDSTLLDVNRMLTNKTFRTAVVEKITDPVVRSFWTEEFATYTDTYTREATPAIQNKVGQFTSNPLIRNIVGQARSSFDIRKIMDEKKIFIVNLSKGRMGETNAALLGSMLVVKIYLAAMSRADEPAVRMRELPRFYFYVDEFQSMMNEAFADILSESRKYKLALTLANQYIEQMEEKVRDAVFGNVGTLVCFRVGPFDAEVLKTVFEPTFMVQDLVGLGIGQIYLTLMIDGVGSAPFSAETLPPIDAPSISYRDDVVRYSRAQYSRPRGEIEALVAKRQKDFAPPSKAPRVSDAFTRRPDTNRGGRAGNAPQSSQRGDRERRAFVSSQNPVRPNIREHPFAEGERSALRAAIVAAAPRGEQRALVPMRSPADILRERLARKARVAPGSMSPAQSSSQSEAQRVEQGTRTRPVPTGSVPPRPDVDEKNEEAEEVTHEELLKILKGEA
ncbi:type IV secretion system DNA-binding domain-containing protein [Candidatus Kaiserbacteria bacterium]|nr:type IV secretion system DNA-binding domain-containing protein [Candidatus Kaiserbacteria bacterium]